MCNEVRVVHKIYPLVMGSLKVAGNKCMAFSLTLMRRTRNKQRGIYRASLNHVAFLMTSINRL